MADDNSPSVEIAPTVIVSNSSESDEHASENNSSADGNRGVLEPPIGEGSNSSSEENPDITIAAIEAERDIALATIHSETERERISLEAERIETIDERNEEIIKCREEIANLTAKVEALEILLTPPPQLEVTETETELETVPEKDLTHPDIAAPINEIETEPSETSEEEKLEEIIPKPARKFIAI